MKRIPRKQVLWVVTHDDKLGFSFLLLSLTLLYSCNLSLRDLLLASIHPLVHKATVMENGPYFYFAFFSYASNFYIHFFSRWLWSMSFLEWSDCFSHIPLGKSQKVIALTVYPQFPKGTNKEKPSWAALTSFLGSGTQVSSLLLSSVFLSTPAAPELPRRTQLRGLSRIPAAGPHPPWPRCPAEHRPEARKFAASRELGWGSGRGGPGILLFCLLVFQDL